jgi:hypothetical protein
MIKAFINLSVMIFLLLLSVSKTGFAQHQVLYQNNFETPLIPPVVNCGPDIDQTAVNLLWGGTGIGIGGAGQFQQEFTIETILINGPNQQYTDAIGLGGNYCLGMLSSVQNDRVALTLNSQMLPSLNTSFLLSPIDMTVVCGGPFGVDTAVIHLTVYDSPTGTFSFSSPGTILDEVTIVGGAPGPTSYCLNWFNCATSLDISNSIDGNITVVFDLIRSGYAAIDVIEITSSNSPSFVQFTEGNNSLVISPNPFTTDFEISGTNASGRLIIFDEFGKKVYHQKTFSSKTRINTEKLLPGFYFLNYFEKNKTVKIKLVKI